MFFPYSLNTLYLTPFYHPKWLTSPPTLPEKLKLFLVNPLWLFFSLWSPPFTQLIRASMVSAPGPGNGYREMSRTNTVAVFLCLQSGAAYGQVSSAVTAHGKSPRPDSPEEGSSHVNASRFPCWTRSITPAPGRDRPPSRVPLPPCPRPPLHLHGCSLFSLFFLLLTIKTLKVSPPSECASFLLHPLPLSWPPHQPPQRVVLFHAFCSSPAFRFWLVPRHSA